jgi:hypothetical protein
MDQDSRVALMPDRKESAWVHAVGNGDFISDKYRLLKHHQSMVTKMINKKPISIELTPLPHVGAGLLAKAVLQAQKMLRMYRPLRRNAARSKPAPT